MNPAEIPWLYNEAFDPHYGLDSEAEGSRSPEISSSLEEDTEETSVSWGIPERALY